MSQWIVKKNPFMLTAGEEEKEPYLNMPERSVLFNKACHQDKQCYYSKTCWNYIRACMTWEKGRTPLQPPLSVLLKPRGICSSKDWDIIENYRMLPFPHTLSYIIQGLFLSHFLFPSTSCPSFNKKLQGKIYRLKRMNKYQGQSQKWEKY